jgi:hypothetical protein
MFGFGAADAFRASKPMVTAKTNLKNLWQSFVVIF